MKHSQRMWAILVTDAKGKRFLPFSFGVATARTRRECVKVLKAWRAVRVAYKPAAKVVRVRVSEV